MPGIRSPSRRRCTGWQNNLNYNLGIFAQDRWTLNRLTLNGGLRLDFQNESTEPFTAGPHHWAAEPERHVRRGQERAELEGRRSARFGGVRSVRQRQDGAQGAAPAAACGRTRSASPRRTTRRRRSTTSTARDWTDSNGNFVPDCNLLNPRPGHRRTAVTCAARG